MAAQTATSTSTETDVQPEGAKVLKATTIGYMIPTAGWSALMIAGGVTLAVTTGGIGLMALGAAAALVGAQKTYTRLRKLRAVSRPAGEGQHEITVALTRPSKLTENPALQLAAGAVVLSAGIALTVASAGGALAGYMILPMLISGGWGTLRGGFRLGRKVLFRKKEKAAAANDETGESSTFKVTMQDGSLKNDLQSLLPAKKKFDSAARKSFDATVKTAEDLRQKPEPVAALKR